ncbi:type IV secretory system conjugative DNA transfer family protein [Thalassobaculum litoreum]|uniref:Type IV secretion system protein VirD4 n=1 Tax=Thalassobaculum litoreum DSM 18839 TaxID=1123362 RepID=A0A8G2BHF5_9PROT|nr:type IV secretory system conjugative DNA transfer family protein [Thalassobaculum litoreum]SDF61725.1 type IV secretion system protein VirD4 [Thalassobaculum litoreum DSM 18839]
MSNAESPFGSARFSNLDEIKRAGMIRQKPDSLFLGFYDGHPLFSDAEGGWLQAAGARGGKLRDVLGYNICSGIYAGSMLILDMKGELAMVSLDQTPDGKFCFYWNPDGLHGVISHRVNPVDPIRKDSRSLVSDVKVLAENMIPLSGSPAGEYFERRGREYFEALALAVTERDGVLTLPALYTVINLVVAAGEAWLNFAFEMHESGHENVRRIEKEIAEGRDNPTGGFQGILGELMKSVACLSDPQLMASVSPPFDFSLEDLIRSDQAYQIYLMVPPQYVEAWAPVLRALFTSGLIYKSRSPAAPRQTWVIDECAQLGAFPLVPKLFTYGAGIGIRPWAVFQSIKQMKALGPDADTIILSSAAVQQYFAVRDLETGATLSRMLGMETLSYEDERQSEEARHAREKAMRAIMDGGDPLDAALSYEHAARREALPAKRARSLMTPDEILNMPGDKQILFADGLAHPIYADRRPYYEQRFMAGRYHPNPYHPPADRVRVKTLFGHGWKKVVREPVPDEFAHYPQYRDGTWSKVR